MSPLRQALADYLQIRRALGHKLERAEKLLPQYLVPVRTARRVRSLVVAARGPAVTALTR